MLIAALDLGSTAQNRRQRSPPNAGKVGGDQRRQRSSKALSRSALTFRRESLPLDDDLPVRIDSVVSLHDQRERATGRSAHEPEHLSVRADEAHGRLAERAVILPLHPELLTALGSGAP